MDVEEEAISSQLDEVDVETTPSPNPKQHVGFVALVLIRTLTRVSGLRSMPNNLLCVCYSDAPDVSETLTIWM